MSVMKEAVLRGKVKSETPVYTHAEELFNAISHIVGGGLGVVFAVVSFFAAALGGAEAHVYVALGIYSLSMIILYTMSALYHFLPQGKAKRVFRIFDHCTIYLLIAGCYTPFCLITFWGDAVGIVVLSIEWGLAAVGIALNATMMTKKAVKIVSMIGYVVMGWMIVLLVGELLQRVSVACFGWLLLGGIFYTAGLIFYAMGKKKSYMHCVWHLFVLAGSVLQFVSIFLLL